MPGSITDSLFVRLRANRTVSPELKLNVWRTIRLDENAVGSLKLIVGVGVTAVQGAHSSWTGDERSNCFTWRRLIGYRPLCPGDIADLGLCVDCMCRLQTKCGGCSEPSPGS